jgi:hypothetical protein
MANRGKSLQADLMCTCKIYHQRAMSMIYALDFVNAEVKAKKRKYALDGILYDSCSNGIAAVDTVIKVMNGKNSEKIMGKYRSCLTTYVGSSATQAARASRRASTMTDKH